MRLIPWLAKLILPLSLLSSVQSALATERLSQEATDCVVKQLIEVETQIRTGTWTSGRPFRENEISQIRSRLSGMSAGDRVATCYALARLGDGIARHMPAFEQQVQLHLSPELEPERQRIHSLVEKALSHVLYGFKALAPLQVHIYLGESLDVLRGIAEDKGFGPDDMEWPGHDWHQGCQPRHHLVGTANARRILICFDDLALPTRERTERSEQFLLSTLAHEYFHSFQLQVTASLIARAYYADPLFGRPGPSWMIEGVAHYVGYRVSETPEQIRKRLEKTAKAYGYSVADRCRVLKRQEASFEATDGPRAVALLAVTELESLAGPDSFARFYGDLGLTRNWRESFERVYGRSPEEVLGCPSD